MPVVRRIVANNFSHRKSASTVSIPLVLLSIISGVTNSAAGMQESPSVEARARAALEAMSRAYRALKTLDQETTYSASGTAMGRLVKSRLVVQRPNRLLLEV